jgi:BTB/POZ domain-containing protein KCTD9
LLFVVPNYRPMQFSTPFKKLSNRIHQISEKPVLTSFYVLIIVSVFVMGLSLPYYLSNEYGFYAQILAEAHGMIFDIAIIGILIFWLNKNGEKRLRIRTYRDEIDDFRLWKSDEATFRTVGNIKRLNSHRINEVNLVSCHLTRANMNYLNLKGSNLNLANLTGATLIECNLVETRLNQTNFENATLNQANLSGAFASGANFKDSFLIKSVFENAMLIKANFQNAFLMEADLRGANLAGADFENANLYKADLRGAIGLTIEQLVKTKTLYLAKMDEDLMVQIKEHSHQTGPEQSVNTLQAAAQR